MKRWLLTKKSGFESLQLVETATPQPGAGQVLIRITALSLNYRDLVLAERAEANNADGSKSPISDGVGEIVAVGPDVTDRKVGERVIGSFFATWHDGPFDVRYHAAALGGSVSGMASEYVVLDARSVVPVPKGISDDAAATLPCAGLTAWNALFESATLAPGHVVAVEGTGGVSILGLQLAKAAGAQVVVTSSSNDKLAKARELGASHGINYKSTPKWGAEVAKVTGGAHNVLEVGGPGTFDEATAALRANGVVSLIGVLTGVAGTISTYALIHSALRVHGIYVGSAAMLSRLVTAIAHHGIEPVVDKTFAFDELREAYAYQKSGAHFGKVVVRL